MTRSWFGRGCLLGAIGLGATFVGGAVRIVQDTCGPFVDVSPVFCPFVLEAYYMGITAGTSPTTFSPDVAITRGQAAVFTTKALNQALARGSRRAALGQWWTTSDISAVASTPIGYTVGRPACDGTDIWVPLSTGAVVRVRGSDGRVLETWTGAVGTVEARVAMGRVFVMGYDEQSNTTQLFVIDPSQPAGALTPVATNLKANGPMAFDGSRLWAPNDDGTLSFFTPTGWVMTTVPGPIGSSFIVFDGASLWVPAFGGSAILRLDSNGTVTQTVNVAAIGATFDGGNLWLMGGSASDSVTVVQASTGAILRVLTGNGLASPLVAGFDGQRVIVANLTNTVSLWNAASLAPLGLTPSW